MNESGKVFRGDVLPDICGLKLSVNSVLGSVAVRVWSDPSVVVDCGVQRLGAVGNVVSEPARVESDRMFDRKSGLMRGTPMPVLTKSRLQPAVNFQGDVWLQSHAFGKVVVGMVRRRGALFVELAVKLVAAWRKRIQPRDPLQIDEVIRFLRVLQCELRGTSPAVGLWAEVGNFGNRMPQESRHVSGNVFDRDSINVFVPFVAPAENVGTLKAEQHCKRCADQPAS